MTKNLSKYYPSSSSFVSHDSIILTHHAKQITTCCWGGYYGHTRKFIQNPTQATHGVPDGTRGFLRLPAAMLAFNAVCYHMLSRWAEALGESEGGGGHGTLCRRGKCKLSTEMWKLIYGLYFRDCGTVTYMSPCHFFFRCCTVSYVLFIYGIIYVSKGFHCHAQHCWSQRCLVLAHFLAIIRPVYRNSWKKKTTKIIYKPWDRDLFLNRSDDDSKLVTL